jgi:hypothetical protein
METGIQSSFIPKEAGKEIITNRPTSSSAGLPELFVLISIIFLVASGALAGGVFLYQQFLHSQITSKSEQLKRAEKTFEHNTIQKWMRLDQRMHAASEILSAHLAPSVFFGSLNQTTLTTVSFNDLQLDASNPAQINIKMTGVAQSVNSVAFQANLFNNNSVITNPIFSKIDHKQDGVHFELQALVNSSALSYAHMFNGSSSANSQSAEPVIQAPTEPVSPVTVSSSTRSEQATTSSKK